MKLTLVQLKAIIKNLVTEGKISNKDFNATRNNSVGLLDKIAKIVMLDTDFGDKLAELGGDQLEWGHTIEEWFEDLILPEDYDASGSSALNRADGTYRPVYYSYELDRKKIKTTIANNDIERAVHNPEQFASVVTMKSKRLNDSELSYKYGIKREMLGKFIGLCEAEMSDTVDTFDATDDYAVNDLVKSADSGTILHGIIVKPYDASEEDVDDWDDAVEQGFIIVLDLITELPIPVDTETGEAFIKQIKKDAEVSTDESEGHSLNGNTLGTSKFMKLYVKQGVIPSLEVDTQAGCFQLDKIALPVPVSVIKDFGSASDDVYAILVDYRGAKLHPCYRAVREQGNADGDFINIVLHSQFTAYISRNVFIKVYKKPSENKKTVKAVAKKSK